MKYRKLRIAWSVAWGLLAVLLCVLWVRSYTTLDEVNGNDGRFYAVSVTSRCGTFYVLGSFRRDAPPHRHHRWHIEHEPVKYGFGSPYGYDWDDEEFTVIPIVYPVVAGALLAAAPWLPWRFSIRTLLIATTLVAVVLGFVVWLSR